MGKVTQIKSETDHQFEYKSVLENTSKRLDLNNLIKRNRDEAKKSRRQNILIFSGAAFVASTVIFLLSIE